MRAALLLCMAAACTRDLARVGDFADLGGGEGAAGDGGAGLGMADGRYSTRTPDALEGADGPTGGADAGADAGEADGPTDPPDAGVSPDAPRADAPEPDVGAWLADAEVPADGQIPSPDASHAPPDAWMAPLDGPPADLSPDLGPDGPADPCEGVTCPDLATCVGDDLRVYDNGVCIDGACSWTWEDVPCGCGCPDAGGSDGGTTGEDGGSDGGAAGERRGSDAGADAAPDAGPDGPTCGDGVCGGGEDGCTCPSDCPGAGVCGGTGPTAERCCPTRGTRASACAYCASTGEDSYSCDCPEGDTDGDGFACVAPACL